MFWGPLKSSKGSLTLPAWFPPVNTPLKIYTIQASPDPRNSAIGNWTPSKAFFASVVGLPNLSKATPLGIFFPVLAATLIFPLFITETDVSKIKGTFDEVGVPKQIGFVPNKLFLAPWGAIAGGALVKQNAIKFFLTACSA